MEIKQLTKGKDKMVFSIKGINHAYANALRRIIMTEVPTIAIEDVTFAKNSSILYDEMIAHRLGLVVLKTDLKSMDEKTKIIFTLKSKGNGYVYASDLKTTDKKCDPVYPKTPIAKLVDKQELEFEAVAILGTGNEHMKWSPGLVFYTEEPILKIDNKHKDFAVFKDKYPPTAFNKKGELDEKEILKNNLVDACAGVNENVLSVEYSDTNFIFHVESWGQLDCKTMVTTAVEIFNNQLTDFAKLIKVK